MGIYVFSGATGSAWQSDCAANPDPKAGTTARDLVDWIAAQPSLDVSNREPVRIGNATGFSIDVQVADSWTHTCPDTTEPFAPLLVGAPGTAVDGRFGWGVGSGFSERYIVLDVGADQPVAINISAPHDEFEAFLPEAMRLVETFDFN